MQRFIILVLGVSTRVVSFAQEEIDNWPSVEASHTKLQVIVPHQLQINGGYQHRDALFGFPSYSTGNLQTQLIDANSTACEELNAQHWEPPFALMIRRGDCHFVAKVRHAQHAGASAVIISDNSCLCSDSTCMRETGDTTCEGMLPFMADDESGGDITIPSMLIRKSDANNIKKSIKQKNGISNVMVKFQWGIPSPDGRVEWTLWHSSWDEQSLAILKELEPIVDALGDRAFFTPRFASYNGSQVGCHANMGQTNPCGNMCLNAGRYCLLDPSPYHDQSFGSSGVDVVRENLRRKCIWQIVARKQPGVGKKWWRYVNDFATSCNQDELKFKDQNCAKTVMKKNGIDVDQVQNCMQPYGRNVDKKNEFLEEELRNQTQLQLLRLPALYVDGVHARGSINAATMLGMVCAGYGVHDPPKICECANETPNRLLECVKEGSYAAMTASASGGGFSFSSVLFILVLVSSGVASAGYVYWRRSQRQMREQVRSILAEYMPLEDQSMESPRMHPAAVAAAKSPRGFLPTKNLDDGDNDGA